VEEVVQQGQSHKETRFNQKASNFIFTAVSALELAVAPLPFAVAGTLGNFALNRFLNKKMGQAPDWDVQDLKQRRKALGALIDEYKATQPKANDFSEKIPTSQPKSPDL
jgi:hypothetical protein